MRELIDVRDFIQANYTPYEGDASFLTGPTDRTRAVRAKVGSLFLEERARGILDVDVTTPRRSPRMRPVGSAGTAN